MKFSDSQAATDALNGGLQQGNYQVIVLSICIQVLILLLVVLST